MFAAYCCCSSYWLVGMSRYFFILCVLCVCHPHIIQQVRPPRTSVRPFVNYSVFLSVVSVVVLYWILRYFKIRFVLRYCFVLVVDRVAHTVLLLKCNEMKYNFYFVSSLYSILV